MVLSASRIRQLEFKDVVVEETTPSAEAAATPPSEGGELFLFAEDYADQEDGLRQG